MLTVPLHVLRSLAPAFQVNSRSDAPWGLFLLFLLIILGIGIIAYLMEKKRRQALQAVADRMGFAFSHHKDRQLAGRFGFLERLERGRNRYAYNVMSGQAADGSPVTIFDYHYETRSSGSKGQTRTHHHHYSVFTVLLPKSFPELIVEPEGFFSKIAQAMGFDDIDFESVEFSNRYKVKSGDKKFAYDFCNARMIDYLLRQENLAIEVESNVLAMTYKGRMNPGNVIPNYERLQQIRALMPDYIFA